MESTTTSIRINKETLAWIKRLQGILQYQGYGLNIDEVIRFAVWSKDYEMASRIGMTKDDIETYLKKIGKQLKEQAEQDEKELKSIFA